MSETGQTDRDELLEQNRSAVIALLVALFATIVLRNAWLCDDSFVTFRTVDNFMHGLGLRWNVAERVQGFTHPLWALCVVVVHFFTREIFYSVMALSVVVSVAAAYVLVARVACSSAHALLAVLCLCLSRAFIDYSTSGLENPLTHLLLVLFAVACFAGTPTQPRFARLCTLAALLILNRMDTLWLVAPVLCLEAWELWRSGTRARELVRLATLRAWPLLLWLAFALVYYGFPFPNTAYAKLSTGIADSERWHQGFLYLVSTLNSDPQSVLCLVAALALSLRRGTPWRDRAWLAGALLYLLYVVRIGGDFMEGRFFAAPVLMAVIAIARARLALHAWPVASAAVGSVLLVGLSAQHPPPMSDSEYRKEDKHVTDARGVADERGFYYRETGLVAAKRGVDQPNHLWADQGATAGVRERKPIVRNTIGMFGYMAGPRLYIVDKYALTDPLLARMPTKRNVEWRSGHYERVVPKGYLDTLHRGKSRFADKQLGQYYAALRDVIAGPIWTARRWWHIWQLNTGALDHLIDRDRYRHPDLVKVGIATVSKPMRFGTAWDAEGTQQFGSSGIEVYLNGVQHNPRIELAIDSNDQYEVVFQRGSWVVGTQEIRPTQFGGLYIHRVAAPPTAVEHGYDRVRIYPTMGKNFSLGHLFLK